LVGVPEIKPVELRVRPAGRVPEVIDQVYGGTPPVAASDEVYGTPIDPAVSGDVVVIESGGLTVMVSVTMSTAAVGVCESVTETLKVDEPSVVGVPLMTPPVLMVRPGGRVPDESAHVKGPLPPVEVSVVEYGTLTTAVGSAAGFMTNGPTGTGGRPLLQESANPHKAIQIRRETALFKAVISVLMAQIAIQRVSMAQR
jgi:hypothetical protein